MPVVSIILPVFNAQNTLSASIESILRQSFTDFECIIIDNNSTDKSDEIIAHYSTIDKRIITSTENKQGVSYAANKGISMAKGRYLARMDADDISMPDRIRNQVLFLQNNPHIDIVSGNVTIGNINESNIGLQTYVDWNNTLHSHHDIFINRFIESPIVNPTTMVRKEVFDKIGLHIHNDLPEDYELWLRALDADCKIHKLNEIVLEWNDSTNRLTRTNERYSTEAFYKAKAYYVAKWLKRQNNDKHIVIWGAGRLSKKRVAYLIAENIDIKGYIDIKERKDATYYKKFDFNKNTFILSYVGNRGAREKIRKYLNNKELIEGENYLLMA